ncbi:MAG TPA: hypothetical protein VLL96_06690 [Candidatus Deferrimicrobiaceae bacterium]|nr:hypothetical protein [Candidatus Deferrimicrobiaceae bacterium]
MEAEKKFQGATYHLDKMSQLYLKNEEHFTYELDSFLSKIRSVPDVMLEDFNEKYKLGISLGENLYPDDFEMRAKKLGNKDALDFIKWWKKEIGKLWSSSSGPLLTKRNISIHRKVITSDLKKNDCHQ